MPEPLGLYLHVPFCAGGKCPYCDFYSVVFDPALARRYERAMAEALRRWGGRLQGRALSSVYFGGGTPSLLGEGLSALLAGIREAFAVAPDAEITLEANPGTVTPALLKNWRAAGFNRVSLGMQSGCDAELSALGRRHGTAAVREAALAAREAGFDNLSVDLMLATPGQTTESLLQSVDFAASLPVTHVSAYLLKVEPGTPFAAKKGALALPDDDAQAEFYETACAALEAHGFAQYEISNFARPGFEARHNLLYWRCGEYLGLGPAAHGFLDGRRFHFERDLDAFLRGEEPVDDGPGGGFAEVLMLGLRLAEGVRDDALRARFGRGLEALDAARIARLRRGGFVETPPGALRLTKKGFLVSNAVIGELIDGD